MESAAVVVIWRKDASRVRSKRRDMVDRSCVVAIEEERGRARVTQVKKNYCGIGADPPALGLTSTAHREQFGAVGDCSAVYRKSKYCWLLWAGCSLLAVVEIEAGLWSVGVWLSDCNIYIDT